jgi:murein DD-endopeptidase MepM/ murein hydrolase activator NlpD
MMLLGILVGYAAFYAERPIPNATVNQSYLWAEETVIFNTPVAHKGIDFPGAIGTDVYAVADGTVVQVYESTADNQFGDKVWGNTVLLRHDDRHWDSTTNSLSYVYSLYLHLKFNSVIPSEGAHVSLGDVIAKRDNTGNSTGSHLHLQFVLHPNSDRGLRPIDTLESSNRSRNPELWLTPMPGKGTAIGKVTDTNGIPVQNLVVCGLQKGAPTTGYVSSRTYSFPWANSDDILHENFGTTDVTPGTYFLYAANRSTNPYPDTGCGGAHVYDLGNYTFTAVTNTYIGLYPAWLPTVRPTSSWDTQTFIRNHASGRRSVNYTSFFNAGLAVGQTNQTTNSQGTAVVANEQNNAYSGIVVPSQDSSVLLVTSRNGQPAGYTGVVATNSNVTPLTGWERAGRTLHVPLVKKNWVGRWSKIYVTNVGTRTTRVFVTYYSNGTGYGGGYLDIEPNTRSVFSPPTGLADGFYSAVIVNSLNETLAAIVLEGEGSGISSLPAIYNAFNGGNTVLYAPLIKKYYAGNTTGITLQNISDSSANFTATYYDMSGNQQGQTVNDSILAFSPYVLYNPTQIPDGFWGSVRITSTNGKPLVGQMSEGNGSGGLRLMSNLALGGSTTIHLPLWYDNYTIGGSWMSGVNVQNAGTGINNISVTWYNQNGNQVLTRTAMLDNTYDTHNFYDDPALNNFIGSMVIQSTSYKPIAAVSNVRNWAGATGTDSVFAFNGSSR